VSGTEGRGPPVDDAEQLLRVIGVEWWLAAEGRVSSAAFSWPKFSVDRASMTTPEATLARFSPGSGIAEFNCGGARNLGFDTRAEPENGNDAHAHVYCDHPNNKRKAAARKLAEACIIRRVPGPPIPTNPGA
jgi:hypothetical protein